jgi:hypothetical protein
MNVTTMAETACHQKQKADRPARHSPVRDPRQGVDVIASIFDCGRVSSPAPEARRCR